MDEENKRVAEYWAAIDAKRKAEKEAEDAFFAKLSNGELYDYASNVDNDQFMRRKAIDRTVFDFDKAFELMRIDNYEFGVLLVLKQIEDNASQEQLGEVAIWLSEQRNLTEPLLETFCRFITDEKVIERVREKADSSNHKHSILRGLDNSVKYTKDKPPSYRY